MKINKMIKDDCLKWQLKQIWDIENQNVPPWLPPSPHRMSHWDVTFPSALGSWIRVLKRSNCLNSVWKQTSSRCCYQSSNWVESNRQTPWIFHNMLHRGCNRGCNLIVDSQALFSMTVTSQTFQQVAAIYPHRSSFGDEGVLAVDTVLGHGGGMKECPCIRPGLSLAF